MSMALFEKYPVLLDGATYDLKGDANRVKRATDEQESGGFFSKLRDLL